MSIISFFKEAGEKLFGKKAQAAQSEAATADPAAIDAANREAATAIENYIKSMGLSVTGLTVTYDGAKATATVFGIAKDQATKEKVILAAGNVHGIAAPGGRCDSSLFGSGVLSCPAGQTCAAGTCQAPAAP